MQRQRASGKQKRSKASKFSVSGGKARTAREYRKIKTNAFQMSETESRQTNKNKNQGKRKSIKKKVNKKESQ